MALIYHLLKPSQWEQVLRGENYRPASLDDEGFIHCSPHEEVLESARLHFADASELIVLAIPEKRVRKILRWEPSRNGISFPHLYGNLEFSYIETTHAIIRNGQGHWEWV